MSTHIDFPQGVIFNAYPDSIGQNLSDIVSLLERPEFKDTFSLFYILPTIFNSDLDRGFSIIDYNINDELVSREDLQALRKLNIKFKFDLVLNHLSVASPQFLDLLKNGENSEYKDFFINWNEFWHSNGEMGPDGYVVPHADYLEKLFMRKPGFPILQVRFPDGSDRPYWNTFYQEINYQKITAEDLLNETGSDQLTSEDAEAITTLANEAIDGKLDINEIDLGKFSHLKEAVVNTLEQHRQYLGQMDLNAESPKVWDFYDQTLKKLYEYGARLVRLDAFAYLHKQPGDINFFNIPGTWEYLSRIKQIADKYDLIVLPEIHSEYGTRLHDEIAANGYPIYDFFFPGLIIHTLETGSNRYLLNWIHELLDRNIKTINMLGCHDGIPILDLKGGKDGRHATVCPIDDRECLLSDEEIEAIIDKVIDRGGRVKDLYGPDGKKISYYQVNATFFSALGEDEHKLRLARAIQMFMPGIPQVWYLDLFAGRNNYAAADKGGTGGHKEINRTTLTVNDIEQGLKQAIVRDQLDLIKLRNTSPAFEGGLTIGNTDGHHLNLEWNHQGCCAALNADLRDYSFTITHRDNGSEEKVMSYE